MVNFAIIGTNFVTDWFIEAGKKCKGFNLQAVYSRSLDRVKEYGKIHGAKDFYDNLDDLASAENIDAVYIASPNSFHKQQTIKMLSAKKHVLCEKPIASNKAELLEMLDCADKNHVVLLEAMRPVFDPGFKAIKDNLYKLGKIRRATFIYCQYSSRYDKFKNGIIENAFNPDFSNGALMDIGVYCVHPLVKLFGMPDKIISNSVKLSNGIEGAGSVIAVYGDQMQAEVLYSKISDSILPSQIQGEDGSMIIEEIKDTKKITIRSRKDKAIEEMYIEKEENNMYYEVEEFIRLVESGESAKQWNDDSIKEMKFMDTIRKNSNIVFPADKRNSNE